MLLNALRRKIEIALVAASLLFLAQPFRVLADDDPAGNTGFVYVMTNQATDNTVLVFRRSADGTVTEMQEVSTHGRGTGTGSDPLGSQGSLTLSESGRLLLAVDAGSNEVSALVVTASGLQFAGKAPSGGTKPVSVALRGDTAYVLNAAGTPNVTAFRIDSTGNVTMISGSTRVLPGGANAAPAQVGVAPDGEVLVVTEKNTNKIDLFPLDDNGTMAAPSSVPSNGATPFGFTFGHDRTLIVSEAAASSVSSYRILSPENSPTLQTLTRSLADGGTAACWIMRGGALAFAVNSGTNNISSFTISPQGTLQILAAVAGTTPSGTAPIDLGLTRSATFLYVLGTGNGSLNGFRVQNGILTPVVLVTGLPLSLQGIAVR